MPQPQPHSNHSTSTIYNLNPTPTPKNREKWEIGKKNAATLDQRTTSGAGGPASFTGGAASPVSGPSVGAWLWTKQKDTKSKCGLLRPPLHDRSSLLFYELVQLLFACSIYFQRPVLDIQCDMMSHPPAPPNHTFPSLVEGARLSVAYKEIIGKIRELITKEHASSGTWNLKELLLNHKAKLPRNKQIKFHEILIDSAY